MLQSLPVTPPPPRQIPQAEQRRRSSGLAGTVERAFVRARRHLPWVHAAMFVVFVGLILVPPLLPDPPERAGPLDHWTTFANSALWGVWFPLVLLSVIVTGRSWCGLLCPMGAASEFASRHGLKRRVPRWLAWEGTPVVSFVLVTVLGQTLGVRDHAEAAAEVFGGTMLLAVVVGFVYAAGKRPWCRHACPIGLLLGVFSRIGAVQFAPKRPQPGGDRWTDRGVCPTMIDLKRKQESRHCIECFRCVSPPAPGGLYLRLRLPGEEIERIRDHHPSVAEVWFLFIGSGVALGGFLWLVLPLYQDLREAVGVWFIERDWLWIGRPGPWWLMSVHPERREVFAWLDFLMIAGFMLGVTALLTAVLAAATGAAAWLSGRFGGGGDVRRRFVELGYQFAPVSLISLLVGLGGELFEVLGWAGLSSDAVRWARVAAFAFGIAWSLHLADRILRGQRLRWRARLACLAPGVVGCIAIAAGWWPALFG